MRALLGAALAAACAPPSSPRSSEISIPAGETIAGCAIAAGDVGCDGRSGRRRPYVPAFRIDRDVVRNLAYRTCLDAGVCTERPPGLHHVRRAAEVTQDGAEAYCRWRGQRLPTSEEWEKAVRGTDGRMYAWGNDHDHLCVRGTCRDVRSPYGLESVARFRQWVDGRAERVYPRGMAAGDLHPYNRFSTGLLTEMPGSGRHFVTAAFRCARDGGPVPGA